MANFDPPRFMQIAKHFIITNLILIVCRHVLHINFSETYEARIVLVYLTV